MSARPAHRRPLYLALMGLLTAAVLPAGSQPAGGLRRSTTVAALVTYPAFFHGQSVRVRGELQVRGGSPVLVAEGRDLDLVGPATVGAGIEPGRYVEVLGLFLDGGRVDPGDPRLRAIDLETLAERRLGRPRPGFGELPLLVVDDFGDALLHPVPTVRALALEPWRFTDQTVTVRGRFRGRNLFGDQPTAPGRSRWDFVLQVADASIWVAGLRPRGSGLALDVESRADAGRWLEVSGTVRTGRGLVVIDATSIRPTSPADEPTGAVPVLRVPAQGPRPEVVFSTPWQDEVDVPPTTTVRIQVSRDLREATLADRVRVRYGATSGDGPEPPPIRHVVTYNAAARAIEIRFREPLESFRTVIVELLEGIEATDGAAIVPWTLRFTVGS